MTWEEFQEVWSYSRLEAIRKWDNFTIGHLSNFFNRRQWKEQRETKV